MKMQKKAVSALVATVLLILITVAAVGIIWGAIMPMINQATQYGQSCMNARLQINTDSGYTCYNASGVVLANIERGAEDFVPTGIQLVVSGGGQSKVFKVSDKLAAPSSVSELPSNYSGNALDVPGTNEARTYVVNSGMTVTSELAVAPIVKVGNTEKVCDVSSRVTLSACRTG
jgi:flagellin-like protein